jgi:hypothetical protein
MAVCPQCSWYIVAHRCKYKALLYEYRCGNGHFLGYSDEHVPEQKGVSSVGSPGARHVYKRKALKD